MSDKTSIEWTAGDDSTKGATWNPVTGCDTVSEGCDHCYARTMASRLKAMGNPSYQTDGPAKTSGPGFGVALHPDLLTKPLHWKTPRRVFVNSMSDLFHDDVPDRFIADVFAVMALAPQHTFQILTKRPRRAMNLLSDAFATRVRRYHIGKFNVYSNTLLDLPWPLPNVWLGVSVENQRWADQRIPLLLETPAAVRFLSCEPLLGPIDLAGLLDYCPEHDGPGFFCVQRRHPGVRHIGWVIVGGESGSGARPMDLDWARSLVAQCQAFRVPTFVKQLGAHWGNGDDRKAGNPERWPEDLRVREFPRG